MNRNDIFEAIDSLPDKLIAEAAPTEKRKLHLSKKATALMLAAALLVTGTVSAVAIYRARIGKSIDVLLHHEPDEEEMKEIEDNTESFNGSIMTDTFDNIEFSIDGVTHYNECYDYVWVTATRTDGGSFDTSDEYEYYLPLTFLYYFDGLSNSNVIPYDRIEQYRSYDGKYCYYPEKDGIYWNSQMGFFTCRVNDDGTLSIPLRTERLTDEEEDKKTTLYVGFGAIIKISRLFDGFEQLTDDEYKIMKSHVTKGAEILKDFTLIENADLGAKYHHEKYDGTGYPDGLKGIDIPLYGRIIAIADAFDAMTANRVYRKRMAFSQVMSELKNGRGRQFDPELLDVFLNLIDEGKIDIDALYADTEGGDGHEG